MGFTRFKGPVYGAKSLIAMAHKDNVLSAANDTTAHVLATVSVPSYEDWYITEFRAYRGSSGSTAVTTTYQLTDDSTVIADLVTVSSVAGLGLSTTLTPTAGEQEGLQVPAGSVLGFQLNHGGSSVAISSDVTMYAYGYIRYIDSTRAV